MTPTPRARRLFILTAGLSILVSARAPAAPPYRSARPAPGQRASAPDLVHVDPRDQLRSNIDRVLEHYRGRPLNTRDHTPWEVMHWIVAYGIDAEVQNASQRGQAVTAIGWLCFNRPSQGQRLFYLSGLELRASHGPGVQGHEGQFLAMLAQAKLKTDYPIHVNGREFTVADLIEAEKRTCRAGTELTFKLIALNHYLQADATWENELGQRWDIERLVREELAQPVRGAACGGTHRLGGLSLALRKRVRKGLPLEGDFARANEYIRQYEKYALKLQNSDGSFSTQWFHGRGTNPDAGRRLKTSGHILEWLTLSLTEEELEQPKLVRAANYLTQLLWRGRTRRWEVGPLGHGLHALSLYRQRALSDESATDVVERPGPEDSTVR